LEGVYGRILFQASTIQLSNLAWGTPIPLSISKIAFCYSPTFATLLSITCCKDSSIKPSQIGSLLSTFSPSNLSWNIYMQFVNSLIFLYTFKNFNKWIFMSTKQINHFHHEIIMSVTCFGRLEMKLEVSFKGAFILTCTKNNHNRCLNF
jgi:hypothetical protein